VRHRYKLTPEARRDLLSIWEFIACDNIGAADRVVEAIHRACGTLARFPFSGHKRADVRTTEPVLFWPVGSYIIVYRPAPKPVVILRVLHGARDLDALL
jgi:plasmid stabilization system protein ParE